METKQRVSRIEFIENQRDYCDKINAPFFMPSDGFCYSCGQDIVTHFIDIGLKGNEELITGCPYCNYSYVE